MQKNDYVAIISRDFDDLCHYGVTGMKRGVYGGHGRKYQNHAVYARGNPRYKRKPNINNLNDTYFNKLVEGAGDVYWETGGKFNANWDKSASLGLRALKTMDTHDKAIEDDAEWREWFLYEDQTIGMPQLAYLMAVKNYSADDCKKLLEYGKNKYANSEGAYGLDWNDTGYVFSMYMAVGDNSDHILTKFIDACDSVMHSSKKK